MRRIGLFLMISLFMTNSLVMAEPAAQSGKPIAEQGKARIRIMDAEKKERKGLFKKGKLPSSLEWETKTKSLDGKEYYQIRYRARLFNEQSMELTSLIEIGIPLQPTSHCFLRKDPGGTEIERHSIQFDNPSWDFPKDMYPIEWVSLVIRKNIVEPQKEEGTFHIWLSDFTVFRMKLKLLGKKNIQGPLGNMACYEVKMEPDIRSILSIGDFFAMLLQPLMPNFYFWFREEEPYPLVRFEGPLGPPGSPKGVMEVIEYRDLRSSEKESMTEPGDPTHAFAGSGTVATESQRSTNGDSSENRE